MRKKRSSKVEIEELRSPGWGCMSAVFQRFNFHFYPFALHNQSSLQPTTTTTTNASFFQDKSIIVLQGVEAPRNSLELEKYSKETAASSSSSSTQITDKYLNIKMDNNTPSIKTPNLVARLMGLDLLPQTTTPKLQEVLKNPSFKNIITTHLVKNIGVSGTVSLPETPRISTSRRSDVEHHRLSLQLQKEKFDEESKKIPAFTIKTQRSDQIVKQVKEKVSRTFGSDLTNTINGKKDSCLVDHISSIMKYESDFSGQMSRKESELESSIADLFEKEYFKLKVQVRLQKQHEKSVESCDLLRKPQQSPDGDLGEEEAMLDNKAIIVLDKKNLKKTPLSTNDLVNKSSSANQHFHKQGQNHSSQAFHDLPLLLIKRTKQKQSYNSSNFLYNEFHHKKVIPTFHTFQEKRQPNSTTSNFINNNSQQQHHYIQKILKGTTTLLGGTTTLLGGEENNTLGMVSSVSPTHFRSNKKINCTYGPHEVCTTPFRSNKKIYGTNGFTCTTPKYPFSHRRCRKKRLIFHLVDQLLDDMLVDLCMNLRRKRWIVNRDDKINGSDLIEKICLKIKSLPPAMNCRSLEDIDELIYDDYRRLKIGNKRGAYEEEDGEIGECMVLDIGDYIVEELVHEMVLGLI